jgi:hypothetical protein
MQPFACGAAPELLEMTIETLDLGEEARVGRVLIEYADRIVGISSGDETAPDVTDRLQVPGRNVTADTDDREITRLLVHLRVAFVAWYQMDHQPS